MLYKSTRGDGNTVTSSMAIKQGLSPDGGLYVPAEKVTISNAEIAGLVDMSYRERCLYILEPYLSDFNREEIVACINSAYNDDNFDHPEIAPLQNLDDGISVLELWHGPTCAFKDMALQIMPHLLVKSMVKTGEDMGILILVATSGDTGKAALEGYKDVPNTAIVVFYPDEGVSQVQKLQMATQEGNNVGVIAVRGNFDDAQTGVKKMFGDTKMITDVANKGYRFSSANSINWGRLAPQIVYYFSSYADLLRSGTIKQGDSINFVVPTGNFGNILAGYYARSMGLPVHKLICASNANDVLNDFIRTGVYDRRRGFKKTISPSMDILISSNLERLLFELTGHDSGKIRRWMSLLNQNGIYEVDPSTLEQINDLFWSDFATDEETLKSIKDIYDKYDYLIDPHTAVGLNVYKKYRLNNEDNSYTVVLSTASPFKFNTSVAQALMGNEKTSGHDEFTMLKMLSEFSNVPIPSNLQDLDVRPILHNSIVDKEKMDDAVVSFLLSK